MCVLSCEYLYVVISIYAMFEWIQLQVRVRSGMNLKIVSIKYNPKILPRRVRHAAHERAFQYESLAAQKFGLVQRASRGSPALGLM